MSIFSTCANVFLIFRLSWWRVKTIWNPKISRASMNTHTSVFLNLIKMRIRISFRLSTFVTVVFFRWLPLSGRRKIILKNHKRIYRKYWFIFFDFIPRPFKKYLSRAVLRIHDPDPRIHASDSWIRILLFSSLTFKMPAKNKIFNTIFSAYYFLKLQLHHFSKIKSQKESQNSRNQGFSYYFYMMIGGSGSRAGSGSGSIPLTSGSGSGRPKHVGPVDPDLDSDPQHWSRDIVPFIAESLFSFFVPIYE
jgi:hypothetical protein